MTLEKRKASSSNGTWKNRCLHAQESNKTPIYPLAQNSKWTKDLNVKMETLKLTEEKLGSFLSAIGVGRNFLNRSSFA